MRCLVLIVAIIIALVHPEAIAKPYDLVINNGRVIDPETGLDDVRYIGVSDGTIKKISKRRLQGDIVIDATGLVVAPGFIDRNSYTLGPELFRARAADGVTTTFNFEEGAIDVPAAYAAQEGKALINYGFSSSWGAARLSATHTSPLVVNKGIGEIEGIGADEMAVLADHALTDDEQAKMLGLIEAGLRAGAPAIGLGVEYFPGATNKEILAVFDLAAKYNRSVQIHMRKWDKTSDHAEVYEILAGAMLTSAQVHISHLNSSGAEYVDLYLKFLEKVKIAGISVTSECYPYTAGMNDIRSAGYQGWREWSDERFERYQWAETGERLTRETFGKYREQGGSIIIHWMKEDWIEACVAHPLTQIASDGGWDDGKTHPRVAGSNTRVLGRYVREKGLLSLNDAIRKMALLPALSLESAAPQMANKGRLQKGMDADIVIFNPETVIDRATYADPVREPEGIEVIIVNGVVVMQSGTFIDGVVPGQAIRLSPLPLHRAH